MAPMSRWSLAFVSLLIPTLPGCGLDTYGLGNHDPDSGLIGDTTATSTAAAGTSITTAGETPTTDLTTGEATGCVPVTWYFDIDKDGYGGSQSAEKCGSPGPGYTLDSLDCNDSKPEINPDAIEKCDTIDNDCDGGIDEYPAGNLIACNGCRATLAGDSTYYFCDTPQRDRDGARAHCMTLLGDLAILTNGGDEQSYITSQFDDLASGWWIGLSDDANEGQFVWVDGSPFDPRLLPNPWAPNEPDNMSPGVPGSANCIALNGLTGLWNDYLCTNLHATVCESPGL